MEETEIGINKYDLWQDYLSSAIPGIVFGLAITVVTIIVDPGFLSLIESSALSAMPLAFLGIAEIFVLSTGNVDLSAGAGLSLVNVVTVAAFTDYGIGGPLLLFIPLGMGLIIGFINGVLVGYIRLNSFLATIATTSVWSGAALFVMSEPRGNVPGWFTELFQEGIVGIPSFVWLILLAVIIWLIFRFHSISNHFFAAGSDAESAFATGINVPRIRFYSFLLNGLMIGFAGLIMCGAITSGDPGVGDPLTLTAIIAALIGGGVFAGGEGSGIGVIGGAIGLGFMRNLIFFLGVSSFHQDLVYSSIIVALMVILIYVRRKGILG